MGLVKTQTRIYTDTPPTAATGDTLPHILPAISISGNKLLCVRVDTFSEGRINQLVVKQSSGSGCNYTVELLKSVVPYPVGEQAATATPVGTVSLYRIVPQQVNVTSGQALELLYDMGRAYSNVDGSSTLAQRYVYLVIIPISASGTTKWDAAIVTTNEIN
jgi:hypothetical protein